MPTISYACLSDPGRTHLGNQDRWFADPALGLYFVTDGMAVEEPAQLVVDLLPDAIRHRLGSQPDPASASVAKAIGTAIAVVSRQVHETALKVPDLEWLGLGATIALALVKWPHALLAHLGDSRIYLWRGGRLEPMTRDHSFVEELVQLGKLTRADVDSRSFNGGPTRFAGMAEEAITETQVLTLAAGDRLLLCSDGLPAMLDDSHIETILNAHPTPEAACRALIDAANEAGGEDNVTVLVIETAG
jgi:protein phosphatase